MQEFFVLGHNAVQSIESANSVLQEYAASIFSLLHAASLP